MSMSHNDVNRLLDARKAALRAGDRQEADRLLMELRKLALSPKREREAAGKDEQELARASERLRRTGPRRDGRDDRRRRPRRGHAPGAAVKPMHLLAP
jgi:hypothetical protein